MNLMTKDFFVIIFLGILHSRKKKNYVGFKYIYIKIWVCPFSISNPGIDNCPNSSPNCCCKNQYCGYNTFEISDPNNSQ